MKRQILNLLTVTLLTLILSCKKTDTDLSQPTTPALVAKEGEILIKGTIEVPEGITLSNVKIYIGGNEGKIKPNGRRIAGGPTFVGYEVIGTKDALQLIYVYDESNNKPIFMRFVGMKEEDLTQIKISLRESFYAFLLLRPLFLNPNLEQLKQLDIAIESALNSTIGQSELKRYQDYIASSQTKLSIQEFLTTNPGLITSLYGMVEKQLYRTYEVRDDKILTQIKITNVKKDLTTGKMTMTVENYTNRWLQIYVEKTKSSGEKVIDALNDSDNLLAPPEGLTITDVIEGKQIHEDLSLSIETKGFKDVNVKIYGPGFGGYKNFTNGQLIDDFEFDSADELNRVVLPWVLSCVEWELSFAEFFKGKSLKKFKPEWASPSNPSFVGRPKSKALLVLAKEIVTSVAGSNEYSQMKSALNLAIKVKIRGVNNPVTDYIKPVAETIFVNIHKLMIEKPKLFYDVLKEIAEDKFIAEAFKTNYKHYIGLLGSWINWAYKVTEAGIQGGSFLAYAGSIYIAPMKMSYWFDVSDAPSIGLVAYYPFDGDTKDKSGSGNDGQMLGIGGMIYVDGQKEKAIYFPKEYDLNNPNRILIKAMSSSAKPEEGWTYSFWIKTTKAPFDDLGQDWQIRPCINGPGTAQIPKGIIERFENKPAITKSGETTRIKGYGLALRQADSFGEIFGWHFQKDAINVSGVPLLGYSNLKTDGFNHIVFTFIKKNANTVFRIYLNNEITFDDSYSTLTNEMAANVLDANYDVLIGAWNNHQYFRNNSKSICENQSIEFDKFQSPLREVALDEFRIYNRVLTESEIKQLYDFDKKK